MKKRIRNTTRTYHNRQGGNSQMTKFHKIVLTTCFALLFVGYFVAAKVHFASMQVNYESETLRSQLTQLDAEKRKLIIAKETASDPAHISRAARGLGLENMTARNVEGFSPDKQELAKSTKPSTGSPVVASLTVPDKKVAKTSSVAPTTRKDTQTRSRN